MPDMLKRKRLRPVIRVFVSSTFSDFKVERDALQRRVFPNLEQLCLREGFQFQTIDLRWGVSAEAVLDHRTMQICFEELRRSQEVSPEPNFLILIGNRYGWRPLPEEISLSEFAELQQNTADAAEGNVLRDWYRLDNNSVPPVHLLRARTNSPDGRDYENEDVNGTLRDAPAWIEVQQTLWKIVNRSFPANRLKGRFESASQDAGAFPSIVRFQASATEQEIWCGALGVANASEHVLALFREIHQTGPQIDLRLCGEYYDVESGKINTVSQQALADLKEEIKNRLGENVVELKAAQLIPAKDDNGPVTVSTDHIDELCREVQQRLTAIIERQIAMYWEPSDEGAGATTTDARSARELEIELDEHLRFGNEYGAKEAFVGRNESGGPLDQIRDYLSNDSPFPFVIHGDSGSGKTALLARAFQEISHKEEPIIRFIGVTPRSSDIRALLRDLCLELRQRNPIQEPLAADVQELSQEFRQHLEAASAAQPVVLFLDALDQLSEADFCRGLHWIPSRELPGDVKIVLSCLSDRDDDDPVGQPWVTLQMRNLPEANLLFLDALSVEDAKMLLFDRWLPAAGRTIRNEAQRASIETRLESADTCRQPLFLKLLFEQVKLWRSFDDAGPLGESVTALLDVFVNRLSRHENHGPLLVARALGYISAARRGLSETEILEALFADDEYKAQLDAASKRNLHSLPAEPPRIPISLWSRLRSDLTPYLTERAAPGGNVLTPYHRQLAEWFTALFVDAANWNPNERLAKYFRRQEYFLESLEDQRARARRLPPTPRPVNIRKVDELPL